MLFRFFVIKISTTSDFNYHYVLMAATSPATTETIMAATSANSLPATTKTITAHSLESTASSPVTTAYLTYAVRRGEI